MNVERLQSAYWYDKDTGQFTRRDGKGRSSRRIAPNSNGYVVLMVDGERIYAHRAAWLYVHMELPPADMCIDHINGDRADNRLVNLRLTSRSANAARGRRAGSLAGSNWAVCLVPYSYK